MHACKNVDDKLHAVGFNLLESIAGCQRLAARITVTEASPRRHALLGHPQMRSSATALQPL